MTKDPVSIGLLNQAEIYVTVNAMYDPENWDLPARSAFSVQEIQALKRWVAEGGSLFLVTDHMPCGGSVHELAAAFGINVLNGFAMRKDGLPEIFSVIRKNLLRNELTGPPGNTVDSIMCWGGIGLIVPSDAHVISWLGEDYEIYLPQEVSRIKRPVSGTVARISGRGIANGAYLRFGMGRVVIFADGAPFTAQLQGIKSEKRGMNHPSARQNAWLLLNIIHWLDGNL